MAIKVNIPGLTVIRPSGIAVKTDGGPWAEHNFPCPVCREGTALMVLDGWTFHPCDDCAEEGWELRKRKWWEIWR